MIIIRKILVIFVSDRKFCNYCQSHYMINSDHLNKNVMHFLIYILDINNAEF